ncbi:MAG TPA: DUF4142 domain-containing protein [Chitinophagaceae bacterium]|nr:DUF4142 domain-containing protein [Chitinophagaceae bacterium]
MRNLLSLSALIALTMAVSSCGNNASTDPKEAAEKANDAKLDSNTARTDSGGNANTANAGTAIASAEPDVDFAVAAADGGMMEVELGTMASKKGVSPEIKKLGAMMVKDHSAANNELKAVAKTKNITLPAGLSDKCRKKVQDLTEKTGADFDKAYADLMVSDHKDDIDEFKKEANSGKDSVLTAWARKKVPVLEHHLMMAEQAKKATDKNK